MQIKSKAGRRISVKRSQWSWKQKNDSDHRVKEKALSLGRSTKLTNVYLDWQSKIRDTREHHFWPYRYQKDYKGVLPTT